MKKKKPKKEKQITLRVSQNDYDELLIKSKSEEKKEISEYIRENIFLYKQYPFHYKKFRRIFDIENQDGTTIVTTEMAINTHQMISKIFTDLRWWEHPEKEIHKDECDLAFFIDSSSFPGTTFRESKEFERRTYHDDTLDKAIIHRKLNFTVYCEPSIFKDKQFNCNFRQKIPRVFYLFQEDPRRDLMHKLWKASTHVSADLCYPCDFLEIIVIMPPDYPLKNSVTFRVVDGTLETAWFEQERLQEEEALKFEKKNNRQMWKLTVTRPKLSLFYVLEWPLPSYTNAE